MTKKQYLSPTMKVRRVRQAQMLCGSVNGTFGVSEEYKKVEAGDEGDWGDNLGW